jgi:hypothetical protein
MLCRLNKNIYIKTILLELLNFKTNLEQWDSTSLAIYRVIRLLFLEEQTRQQVQPLEFQIYILPKQYQDKEAPFHHTITVF